MTLRITAGTLIPLTRTFAAPGAATLLPVPYLLQTQNNWCWAACCEMVFKYYGGPLLQQCDLASRQFHTNCCATPSSPVCDKGEWPENVYPSQGFAFVKTYAPLTPSMVESELGLGRPVEIYYAWEGGRGAHVALITGIFDDGDIWVHDPWRYYGSAKRPFEFVKNAYNFGIWAMSYSQISPIHTPAPQTGTV
jgi:Papain-like cysteine protease AvrRpt2